MRLVNFTGPADIRHDKALCVRREFFQGDGIQLTLQCLEVRKMRANMTKMVFSREGVKGERSVS